MDEESSQITTESVSFLDRYFDNSFTLQASIKILKSFRDEFEGKNYKILLQKSKKNNSSSQKYEDERLLSSSSSSLRNPIQDMHINLCNLRAWGLPENIVNNYEKRGIKEMFEWQISCLSNTRLLHDYANLVYSAPTSAGKTLVAEFLAIKNVLERNKKVIMILPFVSVVREKMFYFQQMFSTSGIRVEGFMGSHVPPGGFSTVHIAVCTIEKANSLINKLLEEGNAHELGAVIVDEMHLLGDASRGYILELLITKVKYISAKEENTHIQIIGMSATLPNLSLLSNWLNAELFVTDFRPIPLEEYCLTNGKLIDKSSNVIRYIEVSKELVKSCDDGDYVLQVCLETLQEGCSVLIFCTTKNWCESLSQKIASSFFKLGCSETKFGKVLRDQLKTESIKEILEQLKSCPVVLDPILKSTVSFGVAYHHAGLTFDERDIIEGGFKSGALRILVATSTLSSGVNLPARRVIIRSPLFQKEPINILTYKQMIGRAGRMGKDIKGESILFCTESEMKIGVELMNGVLDPVISCIKGEDKFMRAILEVIASEVASTKAELDLYTRCTLLFHENTHDISQRNILNETLASLINFELVRIQENCEDFVYIATPLGKACLSSSMSPNDGLSLFCELQNARQCLVLESDLHLIYLVTPYSVSTHWPNLDWLLLLNIWESLSKAMKRVGELIGIQESFIVRCVRGAVKLNTVQRKIQIHKRFYTALALQDLVNEIPLGDVAQKFKCSRGILQSLQQSSATFAGMVTAFCRQLRWKNLELLVSQFQDRLHFGIQSELLDLMKLPSLNGLRARSLFEHGLESICALASADIHIVENALHLAVPFQSEKVREGEDAIDMEKRNKVKNIWITGHCGMTAREAAENVITEARRFLELEMGVSDIKWQKTVRSPNAEHSNSDSAGNNCSINHDTHNLNSPKCDQFEKSNLVKADRHNTETNILPPDINDSISVPPVNLTNAIDNIKLINTPEVRHLELSSNCNSFRISDVFADNINSLFDENVQTIKVKRLRMNKLTQSSKSINITPDNSMFSSEDSNSPNLFEETLPVDTQLCSLMDGNICLQKRKNCSRNSFNEDSVLLQNAFLSTFLENKEKYDNNCDQDIELKYDNEIVNTVSDCSSFAEQIESSQESEEKVSILKMKADKLFSENYLKMHECYKNVYPNSKRMKLCIDSNYWKSKSNIEAKYINIVKLSQKTESVKLLCLNLNNDHACDFSTYLENKEKLAIFIDVHDKHIEKTVIGNNIIKKSQSKLKVLELEQNKSHDKKVIKGVSLYFGDDVCFYVKLLKSRSLFDNINWWIRTTSPHISLHCAKTNFPNLEQIGLEFQLTNQDTSIMEWLLDSDTVETSIGRLVKKYCDVDISLAIERYKEEKYSDECSAFIKAWAVYHIAEHQIQHLRVLYTNVHQVLGLETRIACILSKSETTGLRVDKHLASQILVDVKRAQEALQAKANKIYGRRLNFNSSRDVAKALGMYKGRKVSTKKSVLSAHNSPLASIVTYWRKLNAILTRTLYPLTARAVLDGENSRLYATYITHTCTGRVTMHEPNLQNVPRNFTIPASFVTVDSCGGQENIQGVMEFSCRSIFIASSGWVIVSADYCQLEMRILTHMCQDKVLTAIMKSNVDVFSSIAASWGAVPVDQVDDDLRQKVKQLCYGIIYGMGNKTLSQQLEVSELEAAVFMDTFHNTYPAIKRFTQSVITECKDKGYVETLKQRRRYLPSINSLKVSEKNSAERQAVNTTIQGSAADIAKAAMCAVDEHVALCGESDSVRLLLQLHDELIYEVVENKKDFFIDTLKTSMEQAVNLTVPLPVKIKIGRSWGTLQELNN